MAAGALQIFVTFNNYKIRGLIRIISIHIIYVRIQNLFIITGSVTKPKGRQSKLKQG